MPLSLYYSYLPLELPLIDFFGVGAAVLFSDFVTCPIAALLLFD
jgi:hypothetical protein